MRKGDVEHLKDAIAALPPEVVYPVVRHLFSKARRVYAMESLGPGADQSQRDECDINRIMKRFVKTGVLHAPGGVRQGYYGDISTLPDDFLAAEATVLAARESFSSLASDVRERFGNSPVKLLEFLADPANKAEALKLGLLRPDVPAVGGPGGAAAPPEGAAAPPAQ